MFYKVKRLFFKKEKKQTGQQRLHGHWVYLDETTGEKKKGFVYIPRQKKSVYYDEEGHMLYGKQIIQGHEYFFHKKTGALLCPTYTNECITIGVLVSTKGPDLRKCIESIRNQTYSNLEILLMDDGSAEGSLEICMEYEKKDTRIKVFHREHQGAWAAKNEAMEHSQGEALAFVDSRDAIDPFYIEHLYRIMQEHHADVAVGNIRWIEEDKTVPSPSYWSITVFPDPFRFLCMDHASQIDAPCRLVKRTVYEKGVRYSSCPEHEEAMIANRLFLAADRVVCTDRQLVACHKHPQNSPASLDSVYLCLDDRVRRLDQKGYTKERDSWIPHALSWSIINGYETAKEQKSEDGMQTYQDRFTYWNKKFPDQFGDEAYWRLGIKREDQKEIELSIVVPVYNAVPYFIDCLKSLDAATKNISSEILLMDDGSEDESYAIAVDFAKDHPNFKPFKLNHMGSGRARNFAIPFVRGKYLAFADADDMVLPDMYESLIQAIKRDGSDIAMCRIERYPKTVRKHDFIKVPFEGLQEGPTHITKHPKLVMDCLVPNRIIVTSFYKAHHFAFADTLRYVDMAIGFALHWEANQVTFVDQVGYLYRWNTGSLVHKKETLPMFYEHMSVIEELLDYTKRVDNFEVAKGVWNKTFGNNMLSNRGEWISADHAALKERLLYIKKICEKYSEEFSNTNLKEPEYSLFQAIKQEDVKRFRKILGTEIR
ncbi:MAG: glycosyltransferase [Erysipelotrichaceae bacterium]|nr:glycosyltransferase [Erysipelotrichaceae bacterium]